MTKPIKLVSCGGSTSIHIDVRITEEGDLLFSGQDIGEVPEQIFGDSDYEYWLTVPASEKDRLLLALIEKHYAGDALVCEHCGSESLTLSREIDKPSWTDVFRSGSEACPEWYATSFRKCNRAGDRSGATSRDPARVRVALTSWHRRD